MDDGFIIMCVPKLLFKFRSLTSMKDLVRCVDILENNRLFMPKKDQLNDPLEAVATEIDIGNHLLSGLLREHEMEDSVLQFERDKYRMLSLSADCFSPQLWAYYGDTYSGICLCYKTDKHFKVARKVNYILDKPHLIHCEHEWKQVEQAIETDFFQKQLGWKHEDEWRIVLKKSESYFDYDSDELVAVIFGNKIDIETKLFIDKIIPKNTPKLRIYPGKRTYKLYIVPDEYEFDISGNNGWFKDNNISDLDSLYNYVLK